jgi:hypothetical protein
MKTLLLILVLSFAAFGQNRLDSIRKIYIDSLGNSDSGVLIREKLRARLINSGRFEVVEAKENADAVLTGAASVDKSQSGSISSDGQGRVSGREGAVYSENGVLRLLIPQTQSTVWIYEYKRGSSLKGFIPMSGLFSNPSASGRFADKAVKQLLKDAGWKKKK